MIDVMQYINCCSNSMTTTVRGVCVYTAGKEELGSYITILYKRCGLSPDPLAIIYRSIHRAIYIFRGGCSFIVVVRDDLWLLGRYSLS